VNLWDSESVRAFIRKSECGGRRKNNKGYAYKDWCAWKGADYQPDWFEESEPELPFIPLERDLDQLIAGLNPKYAAFLQVLKETAFRPGEAARLKATDFDLERRFVTLNAPEKRSKPRQARISIKLASMLFPIVQAASGGRLWKSSVDDMDRTLVNRRRAVAKKLGTPNIERITFKTFRHWKATTEYHRTKDILYVKEMLGHKNIKNTLIYTHLVDFEESDAYTVKVAGTIEEFTVLLESGFEYVADYDGKKVVRKRK
jgi:integrase